MTEELVNEDTIANAKYFPFQERILKLITDRVGNHTSNNFFRVIIANFFCQLAGCMRAQIRSSFNRDVMINAYTCGIMESGSGKNFSIDIMNELLSSFREIIEYKGLGKQIGEEYRDKLATQDVVRRGIEYADAKADIDAQFQSEGEVPWEIVKSTEAALRQAVKQCQLSGWGSLNMFFDEIGLVLPELNELTALGLQLYDKGMVGASLTKVTRENTRYAHRNIPIPVNMLWMGDPTKLFDGGETESLFNSLLSTGFARRMLFAVGHSPEVDTNLNSVDLYARKKESFDVTNEQEITNYLASLANKNFFDKRIISSEEIDKNYVTSYEVYCKKKSMEDKEADNTVSIELTNRWYKAIRLAGAYAFIDKSDEIKPEHIMAAIKVVEDCGRDLYTLLHQDKPHVRLAKYLVKQNSEVHRADLVEKCKFFKGSKASQDAMLDRAREWAYSNHITIKTLTKGKIDFFKAEYYKETDLNKLIISCSKHIAYNFENKEIAFNQLANFGNADGYTWSAHHYTYDPINQNLGSRRNKDFVIGNFNLIVLDIDEGATVEDAKLVFKDYKYVIYTTKSHMKDKHGKVCERFRIILPLKFTIGLNAEEYAKFMTNFYENTPFIVDEGTKDIARGWNTHKADIVITHDEGELIDPRPYLPNTQENEERVQKNKSYGSIDAITRWFLLRTDEGNRNNMLLRYGKMLQDREICIELVQKSVLDLNSKLDAPLPKEEIEKTIFKSLIPF